MTTGRMEMLQEFIRQNPGDPFPRYGLALEYKNAGRLDEAVAAFAELMEKFPDYVPAYLHAGNALLAQRRREEAASIFKKGIEVASQKRDFHAKGELEAALGELE